MSRLVDRDDRRGIQLGLIGCLRLLTGGSEAQRMEDGFVFIERREESVEE